MKTNDMAVFGEPGPYKAGQLVAPKLTEAQLGTRG